MEMTANTLFRPRQRVWQALNDPETLKAQSRAVVKSKRSPTPNSPPKSSLKSGRSAPPLAARSYLTDLDPPKSVHDPGEGTGGVAGFARGSAKVGSMMRAPIHSLALRGAGACRRQLAQIGSRLIDASSRKMAENFFGRFVEAPSPPAGGTAQRRARRRQRPAPATRNRERSTPATTTARSSRGAAAAAMHPRRGSPIRRLPPVVWVTGLTAVVAGILYYFTRKNESPAFANALTQGRSARNSARLPADRGRPSCAKQGRLGCKRR